MQKFRKVTQLTKDELTELKRAYIAEKKLFKISDLERADELISDEVVMKHYENRYFCDDDFFCNDTILISAEERGA